MNKYNMWKRNIYLFHVVAPVVIGGLIYLLLRDKSLLMFKWFYYLGLDNTVNHYREIILCFDFQMPDWFIYSLPDALWVYSLTSFMVITWNMVLRKSSLLWLIIGPSMGIIGELSQFSNLVSGTFDVVDLFFCICASILPFVFLIKKSEKKRVDNEKEFI